MKKNVPVKSPYPSTEYLEFFGEHEIIDLTARLSRSDMAYLIQFLRELGFDSYLDAQEQFMGLIDSNVKRFGVDGKSSNDDLVRLLHFTINGIDVFAKANQIFENNSDEYQKAIVKFFQVLIELILPKLVAQIPSAEMGKFQNFVSTTLSELERFGQISEGASNYAAQTIFPVKEQREISSNDVDAQAIRVGSNQTSEGDGKSDIPDDQIPEGKDSSEMRKSIIEILSPIKDIFPRNGEFDKSISWLCKYFKGGQPIIDKPITVKVRNNKRLGNALGEVFREIEPLENLKIDYVRINTEIFECFAHFSIGDKKASETTLGKYMSRNFS